MSLPSINLDDRDFVQLVQEAHERIKQKCPGWTDRSPSDPGMMLIDVFAYLTEVMIYRLNRLPEKAYIEFLRLMGVQLQPPTAASVRLQFSSPQPIVQPVEIMRGTRVTLSQSGGRGEPPVFTTAQTVALLPGNASVEVDAYHADFVQGEVLGNSNGLPGQSFKLSRPPVVARTADHLIAWIGVEEDPDQIEFEKEGVEWAGKAFRIWREVENFSDPRVDRPVFVIDRFAGIVKFAPAVQSLKISGLQEPGALGLVPPKGREIRIWYWRGGGSEGNLSPGTLTSFKDPVPRLQVTNPAAASGGRAAETLENAKIRGPLELHAPHRAVTAADFERIAIDGGVARAKAFAKRSHWLYAPPGTVEVLLVPRLPAELEQRVTIEQIRAFQADQALQRVFDVLDERRPLGTACVVAWARYKPVDVKARVVVHRGEDHVAVKNRVLQNLHATINPLRWEFGRALRASDVYRIVQREAGVNYLEKLRLFVHEVPNSDIHCVACDPFQPKTWYAGTGVTLFRSGNDGDEWEAIGQFPEENVRLIQGHPEKPGLLAVVTHASKNAENPGRTKSRIHVSWDCGETWGEPWGALEHAVNDLAWIPDAGVPTLMLASEKGLYKLQQDRSPLQVQVDPADQDLGFYAVAATVDKAGQSVVAVAAMNIRGVYLSAAKDQMSGYKPIGRSGDDVRVLELRRAGDRLFLWAGLSIPGNEAGKGCFRVELRESVPSPNDWVQFEKGWKGGSCYGLAFVQDKILAATHRAGVISIDNPRETTEWVCPPFHTLGLPHRKDDKEGRAERVSALAANREGTAVLAGGPQGVFRRMHGEEAFASCCEQDFGDEVKLPATWLFCSGEHEIEVTE